MKKDITKKTRTKSSPKKPRNKHLTTPDKCRKYLSRIINEVERGELSADKGRCIGYLISVILKTMEASTLLEQAEELRELTERLLEAKGK